VTATQPPPVDWDDVETTGAAANGHRPTDLPANDAAAERAVLAACLWSAAAVQEAADLGITGRSFYRHTHELVWNCLRTLHAAGAPTDHVALAEEMRRRDTKTAALALGELPGLYTHPDAPATAAYHAQILLDHQRRRESQTFLTKLGQLHQQPDIDHAAIAALLREQLDDHQAHETGRTDTRMLSGATWLFDQPDTIDALWGHGEDVLWARGETLLIAGPSGVGKTTIGQQLALARIGLAQPTLLGYPVQPTGRVLYLAMDRPAQARRSLRRMVNEADRGHVDDRLVVWKGPPPQQVIANHRVLLELAERAGLQPGDTVVVDSVKDVAIGIAKDDVGSAVNMALQELLAADIDVLALHHIRKADHASAGKEPATIDELYGSTHIVNGAGSVISIWGAPGDPIVSFKHMKQPASPLGPWRLIHDADRGRTEIWHEVDLLELVKGTGRAGLTAQAAAHTLYGVVDGKPTSSQQEKARRRLERYVKDGYIVRIGGGPAAKGEVSEQARYYLAARVDTSTGEIT
jgi:replicative DNA helicase